MWKTIADWVLAFFGMARELEEHRTTIRRLEDRIRNLEEALKLLAQEQRHTRELESSEREKLLLRLGGKWPGLRNCPSLEAGRPNETSQAWRHSARAFRQ